ncbi:hypothetical protein J8142_23615 [Pseudomonas koreensis]|nr:hypothetical protein [Pseudomonas koreensis]MBP3998194.1 hypothetical protein [Pseudomonas koreensis]MBP4000958.1 hypothetical protein [Pseudomonas koreensis]
MDRKSDVTSIAAQQGAIDSSLSKTSTAVHCPGGHYTVLQEYEYCKFKQVIVEPHQSLSLQNTVIALNTGPWYQKRYWRKWAVCSNT